MCQAEASLAPNIYISYSAFNSTKVGLQYYSMPVPCLRLQVDFHAGLALQRGFVFPNYFLIHEGVCHELVQCITLEYLH